MSRANTNDGEQFDNYFECLHNCEYGEGDSGTNYLNPEDLEETIAKVESPEHEAAVEAAKETLATGCTPTGEKGCQVNKIDSSAEEPEEPDRLAEAAEANAIAAAEDDAARTAAYRAAINKGATRSAAQALSGADVPEASTTNALSAVRNARASTQNDYLEKMGYSNALKQQATNKRKGAFLNTVSSVFGGAGEGAAVGASIGGGR